ncbi:MAG TPA: nuclear transport factor 2 family protein [Rubrivivax sp.]|nr:nuclear transport factor 2 family protein [Rubrivivax sp.]
MTPATIERWHQVVASRDPQALQPLLADDVVFVSPVVHTPQRGRAITQAYLQAALQVLNNASFRYTNEWFGSVSAVLEFECELDGISVNGVDLIHWNAAGLIDHFKVMLRPLKAVNKVHELMAAELQRAAAPAQRA